MPKSNSLSNLLRAGFKTTNTSTASAGYRTLESFFTNLESKTHSKNPPNQKLPLGPKNNLKLTYNLLHHLQLILAFLRSQ
uniref:Uncharacterized protein n=1 Tax=Salix viminalis TaxID=40686 RepID=A0A6N2MEY9_SALVM